MYTLPNVPLPMIEPKSTLHLLTRTLRAGAWCDGGVVSSLCRIDVTGIQSSAITSLQSIADWAELAQVRRTDTFWSSELSFPDHRSVTKN